MKLRNVAFLAILLSTPTQPTHAQRLSAPFPVANSASILALPGSEGILGPRDRDYRYTGFYSGLAAGAGLGIYAIAECSGQNDCAVSPIPFALLTTVVFSITGALIGGMFPK